MKKTIFYVLLLLTPVFNNASIYSFKISIELDKDIYSDMNIAEMGLQKNVLELALKGIKKLKNKGLLKNTAILTIVDYSQSSSKKRLYVIDLINKKIVFNTYVAHGKNTGDEFAKNFSNEPGSLKSSLGFYITENPVIGGHTGLSLLLNGLEKGINDNAMKRAIIIHAADYVSEKFIKQTGRLGRSWGCPALPPELNNKIIETIKGGTCLFIYNPNSEYLCKSSFIN